MAPVDTRLIELLVCPLCKGKLAMLRDEQQHPAALACAADRLAFPIRDGIPVMLEGEAHPYDPDLPPSSPFTPTPQLRDTPR
jgi:uncharacterized protein YbaR (Trm112 family)